MTIISYIINAVPIRNNTRGGGTFYTVASPDLHTNGTGFTSLYVSCDKPECLEVVEGNHESCNRLAATTSKRVSVLMEHGAPTKTHNMNNDMKPPPHYHHAMQRVFIITENHVSFYQALKFKLSYSQFFVSMNVLQMYMLL